MTQPSTARRLRLPRRLPAWAGSLRDPGLQVVVVLAALAAAAFVMLALGWRGVARTPYVPFQLPWLVSAGVAGLALLGFSLGAWSIHLGRRQDAAHRAAAETLTREAAELAETLRASGALRSRRASRPDDPGRR